ncbi:pyridoxamine 5'-phosphate oxidase family protein [Kribbella monticola]|uniref:pyridoxamine 5'-phosphate oxidase family protein n=1 Tax=Kribbella monticola TaxID=2185285 RepID=UPI0018E54B45|nr:pyridoxamine 5'-phosphate oxidase family protein [Kribbella monticola]
MTEPARSPEVRKQHAVKRLEEDIDAWVSTSSADGTPYLMPLSFLWDGETLLFSTAASNPTSLNLQATGRAHVALDHTRDVVIFTATVETLRAEELPPGAADAFAAKIGFDPRDAGALYLYFRFTPETLQSWREANELTGRTLMRDGTWLV